MDLADHTARLSRPASGSRFVLPSHFRFVPPLEYPISQVGGTLEALIRIYAFNTIY